jgi:CIC family chloride channel protein
LYGNQIPFEHRVFEIDTLDMVASVGLAILVSVVAFGLVRVMVRVEKKAAALFPNIFLRGVIGGVIVGGIGWFFPDVLGEGYNTIRAILENQFNSTVYFMTALIALKIVATAFTLGTGSAGGVFAPSLVLGCFTGYLYWQFLTALWPEAGWVSGGCFALLGMAGMISGVLHAPLTGIFLIVEITGGYEVILPLIFVSVLTTSISRRFLKTSIYHRELIERGQLLRPRTDERILADISIMDVLREHQRSVEPDMLLRDFVQTIKQHEQPYFPVIDKNTGLYYGLVFVEKAQLYLLSPELYDAVLVEEIIEDAAFTVSPNDSLLYVMDVFDQSHTDILPVINQNRFLGTISKTDILNQYRKELIIQTQF